MNACYIGIDQSYTGFGLSILTERGHETTVTEFSSDTHGGGVDRLDAIGRWLARQITDAARRYVVSHVCMEGYAYGTHYGREEAGELGSVVKTVLRHTLGSPTGYPTIVVPSQLKKFATNNGRALKSDVLRAVHDVWGIDFTAHFSKAQAHNASDAYVLARMARAMRVEPTLAHQIKVREGLTEHTEKVLAVK